jgi:hypothetical protein
MVAQEILQEAVTEWIRDAEPTISTLKIRMAPPNIQGSVDRRPLPARFLILGSASPDLLHQIPVNHPKNP